MFPCSATLSVGPIARTACAMTAVSNSEWKCSEPARRVNVNSDSENFDLLRRRGQTAGRCSNGYSCCETCRWARMINGMLHARGWRTLHVQFQPAEGSLRVSVRMTVTAGATSTGRNVSLAPGPTWLWELGCERSERFRLRRLQSGTLLLTQRANGEARDSEIPIDQGASSCGQARAARSSAPRYVANEECR